MADIRDARIVMSWVPHPETSLCGVTTSPRQDVGLPIRIKENTRNDGFTVADCIREYELAGER